MRLNDLKAIIQPDHIAYKPLKDHLRAFFGHLVDNTPIE
jgi:hypothetical protein